MNSRRNDLSLTSLRYLNKRRATELLRLFNLSERDKKYYKLRNKIAKKLKIKDVSEDDIENLMKELYGRFCDI